MFRAAETLLERNEPGAWAIYGALAVLNGCASFREAFDAEAVQS